MPTYIALLKWTPQGLQNLKASPSRLDAARKTFEGTDIKLKEFYMVTGQYDMVAICEAPDEGLLARALLSITSKGTLPAARSPSRNTTRSSAACLEEFAKRQVAHPSFHLICDCGLAIRAPKGK
jgi:uncharacterized protein with GYD domain